MVPFLAGNKILAPPSHADFRGVYNNGKGGTSVEYGLLFLRGRQSVCVYVMGHSLFNFSRALFYYAL
jgi:hypothetical protein